jgi:hypothetical protein
VNNDAVQSILIVLLGVLKRLVLDLLNERLCIFFTLLVFDLLDSLTLRETLLGVGLEVEIHWELAVVIDLHSDHAIVVKLEASESNDQEARHPLDAGALQSVNLFVALLAVVGVVAFQHLTLNEGVQTLLDRFLVLHTDAQR